MLSKIVQTLINEFYLYIYFIFFQENLAFFDLAVFERQTAQLKKKFNLFSQFLYSINWGCFISLLVPSLKRNNSHNFVFTIYVIRCR